MVFALFFHQKKDFLAKKRTKRRFCIEFFKIEFEKIRNNCQNNTLKIS